jgi:large subunit ribosomal protein L6e
MRALTCAQEFFDQSLAQKKELAAEYIANQKALDAAILPVLSSDLKSYLSARFSLKDGDRPHLMKF